MEEISGTKSHKLILNNRRTGSFTGILDVLIKSLPMAGFFSELVKAPKSQFAFPFNLHETLFPEID